MSSGFTALKGDMWHAPNESPRTLLDDSHKVRSYLFIRDVLLEVSEEEELKAELELLRTIKNEEQVIDKYSFSDFDTESSKNTVIRLFYAKITI